jgi:hypothetical protein
MHFSTKNTLKNNRNHTPKQTIPSAVHGTLQQGIKKDPSKGIKMHTKLSLTNTKRGFDLLG